MNAPKFKKITGELSGNVTFITRLKVKIKWNKSICLRLIYLRLHSEYQTRKLRQNRCFMINFSVSRHKFVIRVGSEYFCNADVTFRFIRSAATLWVPPSIATKISHTYSKVNKFVFFCHFGASEKLIASTELRTNRFFVNLGALICDWTKASLL